LTQTELGELEEALTRFDQLIDECRRAKYTRADLVQVMEKIDILLAIQNVSPVPRSKSKWK